MRTPLHKNRAARFAALAAVAASLAWSTASVHAGDDDQRIQFAPGTDHGSASGTFSEGEVDNFVLRAGAGQTMFVSVTPSEAGASVAVYDPNGTKIAEPAEPGAEFSVALPASGDYTITVGPGRSEVSAYTLNVRIPAATPPSTSAPQRIRFAPGTDNATVQGSIAPGTTARYALRAAAGQTMTVSVGPDEFAALTTIFGPNGEVVGAGHTLTTANLPATGDYVVEVGNTGSTSNFTLNVRIPAAGSSVPRIQFAPGTDSATVQGTFREGQSDRYVLRAAAGQRMTIQISPLGTGASLGVSAPNGSALPGGPGDAIAYQLPATGDYTIVIGGGRGDSSPTYSMRVTIPASVRRIEFAPATNTASVRDSVGAGTTDAFVLRAGAGQTMAVQIDAGADNAVFSVFSPDGFGLAVDQTQSSVALPSAGDYLVAVHSTGGAATYEIGFWIA
jgi:hypothetical protein